MNVLLVDDHVLFRQGLIHLLDGLDADLTFTEADSVDKVAQGGAFDLVLLDMHMRGLEGTDALAAMRTRLPTSAIVVISGDEDPDLILRCIEFGASGFIPKSSTHAVLISALRLVLAGGVYLPPPVLRASPRPGEPARPVQAVLPGLKPRQSEILSMAIRGKSSKVIARDLGIAEGTVKQHLGIAYSALGVKGRTEAVYRMAELGVRFDRAKEA